MIEADQKPDTKTPRYVTWGGLITVFGGFAAFILTLTFNAMNQRSNTSNHRDETTRDMMYHLHGDVKEDLRNLDRSLHDHIIEPHTGVSEDESIQRSEGSPVGDQSHTGERYEDRSGKPE